MSGIILEHKLCVYHINSLETIREQDLLYDCDSSFTTNNQEKLVIRAVNGKLL